MIDERTIYKFTSLVPKGKVLTYGVLAELARIKSPRVVGNILHKNPNPENIPCHRIVDSKGQVAKNFAFGGAEGQIDKLASEGVSIEKKRVDLSKYLWKL